MAFGMSFFYFLSLICTFIHFTPTHGVLLEPILNPLLSSARTILAGEGLIEGTLGAVEGILGAEQTYGSSLC